MKPSLSATRSRQFLLADLFADLPGIQWFNEVDKTIDSCYQHANLFGYLNPLRSTPIQLVDKVAVEWLFSLGGSELRESPCFDPDQSVVTIMCDGLSPNPSIREICLQNKIILLRTSAAAASVLDILQSKLPQLLSPRCNKHGVFLAIMNTGVLITGVSGVGKSEVGLDLVQRGHQLIADDAVDIYRRDGTELIGECSATLRGHIEIRGLGIINIEKMFGPSSVLESYKVQLIIDLKDATNVEIRNLDRLQPSLDNVEILGIEVPCLSMLVAPGRNLSVLVEVATRDYLLRMSGVDSSLEFIAQRDDIIRRGGAG